MALRTNILMLIRSPTSRRIRRKQEFRVKSPSISPLLIWSVEHEQDPRNLQPVIETNLQRFDPDIVLRDRNVVGFHATSYSAACKIERVGLLPNKILSEEQHARLLGIAERLEIDTHYYLKWLQMRSVTLTKLLCEAVNHARNGRAGGQGLMNVERVLAAIRERGSGEETDFADGVHGMVKAIRESAPVIYVVDLSCLGERLVDDNGTGFYQVFWHPEHQLPTISVIAPDRLIARLAIE